MRQRLVLVGAVLSMLSFICCSPPVTSEEVLFEDPISDLSGVLTRSGVELDTEVRATAMDRSRSAPTARPRCGSSKSASIDVDDTRLVYRARLRTEAVQGQVYLEMWCRLPGRGRVLLARSSFSDLGIDGMGLPGDTVLPGEGPEAGPDQAERRHRWKRNGLGRRGRTCQERAIASPPTDHRRGSDSLDTAAEALRGS